MAATAMARGVNPYEIPRQRTVFGPPYSGGTVCTDAATAADADATMMAGAGMPVSAAE